MLAFARKLRVLVSVNHAVMLAYRAEIYLWVLAHTMPFIMMGLWTTAASGGGGGGESFSMSPVDYKKYFIAVYCVRQFSAVWMIYMFEWEMIEGRLSNYLLKPMQPLWYHVAAHLGEQLARFPFFIVIVGLFMWLNPDVMFSGWDWRMILLGVVAIYAALALRFAVQWCFAMVCFWFERSASIETLSFLPYFFLSGMAVPMGDIKQPLRDWLMWTPFPYMISFPARILTGVADGREIASGALIMSAWFVFFFALGGILWKRGLRKYSGQGA